VLDAPTRARYASLVSEARTLVRTLALTFLLPLALACESGQGVSLVAEPVPEKAPSEMAAATSQGEAPAPKSGSNCGCEHGVPKSSPVTVARDPASGAEVSGVGEKLLNDAPTVSVKNLLAAPDRYAGQRIHLEGNVTGMCRHKRAWFALKDTGDASDAYVRVITAPSFLVPENSVGRQGRTEGLVEVVDVPAPAARHYADDHKLGDPAAPVRRTVIIRATGAEFI
jgi:hypothetical protein